MVGERTLRRTLGAMRRVVRTTIGRPSAPPRGPNAKPSNPMTTALRHLRANGFAPRVTIDVGAAQGLWSKEASELFLESDFLMIDPIAENEPRLIELQKTSRRFRYLLGAVSNENGTASVNFHDDLDSSTLLDFDGVDPAKKRQVPLWRLDTLLEDRKFDPPQFIKIDVQGHELAVLEGATRCLETAQVLIVECNLYRFLYGTALIHEVIGFLAERGFRMYDFAGYLRRPYQNDLGQVDVVFVSNVSPLVASDRWH